MKKKIELGSLVIDPITGYEGIAYSRIIYLQGCDRIGIQAPMVQKEGEIPEVPELFYVDEPQLDLVKSLKQKKKTDPGGPSFFGPSHKR